jgi:hypothetical protein
MQGLVPYLSFERPVIPENKNSVRTFGGTMKLKTQRKINNELFNSPNTEKHNRSLSALLLILS